MKLTHWLPFLNLAGFLYMIGLNASANALPLNGLTTGELSDLYPNLFVPAGFTFSIWGVIYFFLLVHTVFQVREGFRPAPHLAIARIDGFYLFSCLLNGNWIFAWHFQYTVFSLVLMVGLLLTLGVIYIRLRPFRRQAGILEKLVLTVPFSIYFAWISIATVANATAVLVDFGWNGWGLDEVTWTMVMLFVATVITLLVLFREKDFFYGLVPIWAFFGILSKRLSIDSSPEILIPVLGGCMAVMGLGVLWAGYHELVQINKQHE